MIYIVYFNSIVKLLNQKNTDFFHHPEFSSDMILKFKKSWFSLLYKHDLSNLNYRSQCFLPYLADVSLKNKIIKIKIIQFVTMHDYIVM